MTTGRASIKVHLPVNQLAGLAGGGRVSLESVEKGGRILIRSLWEIQS